MTSNLKNCGQCGEDFLSSIQQVTCGGCNKIICRSCMRRGPEKTMFCCSCLVLFQRPLDANKVKELRVKDLRNYLKSRGINTETCKEKCDLVALVMQCVNGEKRAKDEGIRVKRKIDSDEDNIRVRPGPPRFKHDDFAKEDWGIRVSSSSMKCGNGQSQYKPTSGTEDNIRVGPSTAEPDNDSDMKGSQNTLLKALKTKEDIKRLSIRQCKELLSPYDIDHSEVKEKSELINMINLLVEKYQEKCDLVALVMQCVNGEKRAKDEGIRVKRKIDSDEDNIRVRPGPPRFKHDDFAKEDWGIRVSSSSMKCGNGQSQYKPTSGTEDNIRVGPSTAEPDNDSDMKGSQNTLLKALKTKEDIKRLSIRQCKELLSPYDIDHSEVKEKSELINMINLLVEKYQGSAASAIKGRDNKRKGKKHCPSSDDESETPPVKMTKQDFRKFKDDWKQDPKLSCFESHGKKVYCSVCSKFIEGSVSHLYRHVQLSYHKKRASVVSVSIDIREKIGKSTRMKQRLEEGRLLWLKFLCDHNLPFNLMDHLTKTAANVYSDSSIAPNMHSGKTVSRGLVVNCIGKESLNMIVERLKLQKFSLLIDESTDVSTTKQLALVVRFLSDDSESVQDTFLQLIDVPVATADALFEVIDMFFQKHGIPFSNMIGFAADNAAVMMGNQSGLKSKLEKVSPNLFVIGCVCHSLHLCASAACLKLPKTVEYLCRDVYNYLCHSPKRLNEYKGFQQFTNIEPHKVLHPSQTRWLSLQSVVDRLLEQWDALILYFQSAALEDHLQSAQKILSALNNPLYKMYFSFLAYILLYVTKINKVFQSEGIQIHHAYEKICSLYRSVLSNYIKVEVLNAEDIFAVDSHDPNNFKDVKYVYWGSKVQQIISDLGIEASLVSGFRVSCLNFYIELATQIKKRFTGINKVLPFLTALDPEIATREDKADLLQLLALFPNLVPESSHHDTINDEWRNLNFYLKKTEIPSDPVKFWYKVRNLRYSDKSHIFPNLSDFMLSLLVLPHSSAAVERVFSQVKLIKTDHRNRMNTETLNGILLTKMNGSESCHEWKPSKRMVENASKFKADAND